MRYCLDCGTEVQGRNKYCFTCKKKRHTRAIAKWRAKKGLIQKPGSGKGGNPNYGKDNPSYKHGFYVSETQRKKIKLERRYCERCGKDLLNASPYFWVMHHKDHNHFNWNPFNLELLCKRCHQVEHECHKHFESATTIP